MIMKEGPLIIILATDAVEGISFSFEPNQFNLICTDYNHFPVARAVAASSAFPGLFTPIVLKNYAGQCDYRVPEWVKKAIEKRDISSRAYWMASWLNLYTDAKAKSYIYLTDGGISDNLGVRRLLDIVAGQGGLRGAMAQSGLSGVKKVAFLIVDAQTPVRQGAMVGDIPGMGFVLGSTYTIMINRNNFDTVDLLRRYVHDWRQEDIAAGRKPLDVYTIHLSFDSLPEKLERDYFHSVPTTFSLPEDQVDRLRDVAGRLLYSNDDFRKLVADVGGNIPAKTGQPDKAPAEPAPTMEEEVH